MPRGVRNPNSSSVKMFDFIECVHRTDRTADGDFEFSM
ncbi:hypothetical protein K788_0004219 (plasmid) [Paraburkholderia caribensis MBA4]|uniref:Uncharacterized protein n=1 Tax=Paraburkholderia caribensis MBA4 TaxID=1323664 RepID=A0A0P0RPF2_9BURK|nr:hypothetical protein K788_0004219 [Paraburkholderia caribensis MBA4]